MAFYRQSRHHRVTDEYVTFLNAIPRNVMNRVGVREYLRSASSSARLPRMIGVPRSHSENVISRRPGDGRGQNSQGNRDDQEEQEMRDGL